MPQAESMPTAMGGDSQPPLTLHHEETRNPRQGQFGEHPVEAAAQRRGLARGSTGPRSARGKRRSSLNRLKRGLCPGWVAQELRARGEDPEEFRRLHRDRIGWLGPDEARTRLVVKMLAEAWWEKMRRVRGWVGAGTPDTREIDSRLDKLL